MILLLRTVRIRIYINFFRKSFHSNVRLESETKTRPPIQDITHNGSLTELIINHDYYSILQYIFITVHLLPARR